MPWQIERDGAYTASLKTLCKKYPSAEKDIDEEFKNGPPPTSDPLPMYKKKLWKARVGSTDLRRGKSGGFRVIYYFDEALPNWCCLGDCYFKGDKEDLTAKEYAALFASVVARFKQFVDEQNKTKDSGP